MNGDEVDRTRLRSVGQVLSEGRPATAEAVALAAATAAQVAGLHASGRVHGHLSPDDVFVDGAGSVVLGGAEPHLVGPAAPPELRSADLRAVGRILALGLGWSVPDRLLPVPVEDLLARAEAAAVPSAALALALGRLKDDPRLIAGLRPPLQVTRPARRPRTAVVPPRARRTAGLAAGLVTGLAVIGGALLLVAAPDGPPAPAATRTAVAAPRASASGAPLQDLPAHRPTASTSPSPTPRPSRTPARRAAAPQPAPAPAIRPRAQPARPAPRPAVPARRTPRPTRSSAATTSPRTTPSASPAPSRRSPSPSARATAVPTSAPSSAPAPRGSSTPAPRRTATTAPTTSTSSPTAR